MKISKELATSFVPSRNQTVIRVSSNFLTDLGFPPEQRFRKEKLAGGVRGLRVVPDPCGDQKIYQRGYGRSGRQEAVLEIGSARWSATLLGADRFQMVACPGEIRIRPVPNLRFSIIRRTHKRELDFFSVLSSGICAHAFARCGLIPRALCEWRPPEKRDIAAGRDLTETGAQTAARNVGFSTVFNQDIFSVDRRLLNECLGDPRTTVVAGSLQCDSFSPLLSQRKKEKDLTDGNPGDAELFYPLLRLIEETEPAVVFVENVPGFASSPIGAAFRAILTRRGYYVKHETLNGIDFGTPCSRARAFLVASVWPNYRFPAGRREDRPKVPLLEWLGPAIVAGCRDVTGSPLERRAIAKKRLRAVPSQACWAPVFPKSQARVDDRVLFESEGKLLDPSLEAARKVHGIPADFLMDHLPKDLQMEQIGQGVDYLLVELLARSIRSHILANLGRLV